MSDFNSFIKQKADQFEVPYNNAHWAEMEGKLNAIRSNRIKGLFFGSFTVIIIGVLSGYFLLSKSQPNQTNLLAVETSTNIKISDYKEPLSINNNREKLAQISAEKEVFVTPNYKTTIKANVKAKLEKEKTNVVAVKMDIISLPLDNDENGLILSGSSSKTNNNTTIIEGTTEKRLDLESFVSTNKVTSEKTSESKQIENPNQDTDASNVKKKKAKKGILRRLVNIFNFKKRRYKVSGGKKR